MLRKIEGGASGDSMKPEDVFHAWVPYKYANFVILGIDPNLSGRGILASARDEWTANRYAKVLKNHGYGQVQIFPYLKDANGDEIEGSEMRMAVDGMLRPLLREF